MLAVTSAYDEIGKFSIGYMKTNHFAKINARHLEW